MREMWPGVDFAFPCEAGQLKPRAMTWDGYAPLPDPRAEVKRGVAYGARAA